MTGFFLICCKLIFRYVSSMRISKDDTILIVGAGLSGWLTAWALYEQGFEHLVLFEKVSTPSAPAVPGLIAPGDWAELPEGPLRKWLAAQGSQWDQLAFAQPEDRPLRTWTTQPGTHGRSVDLGQLYTWLREQLPADILHTDAEFISFTQDSRQVEAHFLDGQSRSGALLIGADGPASRVRLQMRGEQSLRNFGQVTWLALLDRNSLSQPDSPALQAPWQEICGQGQRGALFPVGPQRAGLSLSARMPEGFPLEGEATKAWLQARFAGWPAALTEAIAQTWPEAFVAFPHEDRPPSRGWSRDRVVLAGRAAHYGTPLLGLEAGLTLAAASRLAALIAQHPKRLDKALAAYEKGLYTRSRTFNRQARRYAAFYAPTNPLSYRLRAWVQPRLPAWLAGRGWRRVIG